MADALSQALRARFIPAEPEIVYHYTTIDTMTKIAEHAKIWATSISYLNDVSEGDYFLDLIRKRIDATRGTYEQNGSIFNAFLDNRDLGFTGRPFIASFSEEPDSLPQWRSYCPQGNGIAIGFKVDCLKRAFVESQAKSAIDVNQPPRVSCQRVEYVDGASTEALDNTIHLISESSESLAEAERAGDARVYTSADYFNVLMRGVASFKKHPSFSNEREYRLLVDSVFFRRGYLEFRASRSTLVPYVPVSIPRKQSSASTDSNPADLAMRLVRNDFIDSVVIGPTANMELSVEAVTEFFRKHNMNTIVRRSKVPYRDW